MIFKYSKSSSHIEIENSQRRKLEKKTHQRQQLSISKLLNYKKRTNCILCQEKLKGSSFLHRNIPFIRCSKCSQIQTINNPPTNFPKNVEIEFGFENVYPKLTKKDFLSRVDRVYTPKLEWILESLKELNYSDENIKSKFWLELGSGAGYFLSSLEKNNIRNFSGLEKNEALVIESNSQLLGKHAILNHDTLTDSIKKNKADIYVMFFVLEHMLDLKSFFYELSKKPKGTIFIFSVPTFGFDTIIENVFDEYYSRHLDGVIHTQLFTEESINYCLEFSGYSKKSEWVFGQDTDDLIRFINTSITGKYEGDFQNEISKKLKKINNQIQHVLDKNKFSDSRHIIAIKQ